MPTNYPYNEGMTRVISQNATSNKYIRDVIGNKTDTSFSNGTTSPSIIGHLTAGYHHVHDSAKVYPTGAGDYGADPITLTASATTNWLHGSKTEVVPVNGITSWFDIHWIIVSSMADADDYELRVFKGGIGEETEIGRIAFSRNAVQDRSSYPLPIQIPPQMPNTRISMSLASGTANTSTAQIKIYYHTYPDIN